MHLLLPLLWLVACQGPGAETGQAAAAGSFLARVPSQAGEDLRLFLVSYPGEPRYAGGAPVVVEAPGGWAPGDVEPLSGHDTWGWVSVVPALPGGRLRGQVAGGTYDHRGPASVEALRDALRYAAGALPDEQGVTLAERLPVPLAADPLTVVGRSNGANLALAALAGLEGVQVGALVQLESPVGDQFTGLELNDNPFYAPGTCTPTTCPWPGLVEALALHPEGYTLAAGHEGLTWPGLVYLDEDGDGSLGDEEKAFARLVLGEVAGEQRLFPSTELSRDLARARLDLPPWLGRPPEVEEFWSVRDGSRFTPTVSEQLPDLVVLIMGTEVDHLQTAPDHPHLHSHYASWRVLDHDLVRLNADAAYLALASGAAEEDLPDCAAGAELPWPALAECLVPEDLGGQPMDDPAMWAALLEAADRVHHGERGADLDAPLE